MGLSWEQSCVEDNSSPYYGKKGGISDGEVTFAISVYFLAVGYYLITYPMEPLLKFCMLIGHLFKTSTLNVNWSPLQECCQEVSNVNWSPLRDYHPGC